ncbi:Endo-1,4-beta-xylanase A precursor [Pelotomaculum schinkii]|uniref:Endo-1,4-beta-xylanase A n=1 Tax=Pelotomaculum schinkii TaxID=78350 RepID=A0A4Y7RGD5_9FIRM|nr:S-layer homology domain-containing protein [Pelotomaculum schinkii]TEB08064.1 Endo-1,4-beta-xylanase A precursor [Pelotomaculum schinkii]
MKLRIVAYLQIALMLLMCVPAMALANTPNTTLSLSKTTASVNKSVTASGTTEPNAWVPLKVVDAAKNIVYFDTTKSDATGNYSIDFIVPGGAAGTLTVVAGEGDNVDNKRLNVGASSSSSGGSGGGSTTPQPVNSTTGEASVSPGAGGKISLGSDVSVNIPANALTGTAKVDITIQKVSSPQATPAGFKLLGSVYEFKVDGNETYTFNKPVTLTFTFDPASLSPGETPAVHYYDETLGKWVNIGGAVSGNTITVQVDHFTKFAVLASSKQEEQPTLQPTLNDIAGHWAENNINQLVRLGAISGYSDGNFKPDNAITRAEFATVLVKAFQLTSQDGKTFADTAGHWAKDYIAAAAAAGVVNGYDSNTFGPDDMITREQMAVMIAKAAKLAPAAGELQFSDSGSISGWAREAIATVTENGIMKGYPDNTIQPQGNATRAEAVTVIVNALNR